MDAFFLQETRNTKIFLYHRNMYSFSQATFLCSQNAVETFYYSVIFTAFAGYFNLACLILPIVYVLKT